MWERDRREPSAYDDDWEDQPNQGGFQQWGLGIILPLAIAGYGASAIVNGQVDFGGRVMMTFHGRNAIAMGVAVISAGVFVHCHYFWGNVYNQAWLAVLAKVAGACGFIGGLGYVLVRNGVWGIQ